MATIAKNYQTSVNSLLLLNHIENSNEILEGQKIYLPRNSKKIPSNSRSAQTGRPIHIEVSSESRYSIIIEGEMESNLLGSGYLYIKEDEITVQTIKINAGGFGSGAPQNGNYTVDFYSNRRPGHGRYNKGMNKYGIGFSFNLNPQFKTGRSLLRIHPDGNSRGTLGCIGVTGSQEELLQFEILMKDILKQQKNIPTLINIENNPNNSVPPKKIKVQE